MSAEQERLVREAMPTLDRMVRFFLAKRPAHLDGDAIRGAAHEALVKAARSFDPATGVPFEAWAYQRIAGAMLDEVRSITFGPRGERVAVVEIKPWDATLEVADRAEARLDLYAALGELTPENRRIVLATFAGYRLRDLAGDLSMTESGVCHRRRCSYELLRSALTS